MLPPLMMPHYNVFAGQPGNSHIYIHCLQACWDSLDLMISADEEASRNFQEQLETIDSGGYLPNLIFNVDETSFFLEKFDI